MGRRPINRVKCPKCKGLGTWANDGHRWIVWHYDNIRYKKGNSGVHKCYIGSTKQPFLILMDKHNALETLARGDLEQLRSVYTTIRLLGNVQSEKNKPKDVIDSRTSAILDLAYQIRGLNKKLAILNKLKKSKMPSLKFDCPCGNYHVQITSEYKGYGA